MRNIKLFFLLVFSISINFVSAQDDPAKHPNTSGAGWTDMFKSDLSNAIFKQGVWKDSAGVFTASADEALWSEKTYNNFILDLEFKNADGTNSGVIVHASNMEEWIPHSVEIQIADDYSEEWSKVSPSWQCAAIFGHQAAGKRTRLLHPGEIVVVVTACRDVLERLQLLRNVAKAGWRERLIFQIFVEILRLNGDDAVGIRVRQRR